MKKLLLFLISFFVVGISYVYSQSSDEPIIIDDAIIGHHYYHGDVEIKTISKMKAIVAKDQLALSEIKKAVVPEVLSYVFAASGGFAIGWQIGGMPFGKFDPYMLAGGVGLAAIGLGFSVLADSYIIKGVRIYNSNIETSQHLDNVKLEFGLVSGGIGLTMYF